MFYRRIAPELYHNDTKVNGSSIHEQPASLPPCFIAEDEKRKRMEQTAKADRRHKRDAHIKARRRKCMAFVDTYRDVDVGSATMDGLNNQQHKPSRKEQFGRFMQNLSLARHAI